MKTFTHNSGQSVEIDGANIYYEEIGNNKDKPALLMLHGGYESIENLNSMAAYLSDNFRVIGIDSRGHGKSTFKYKPRLSVKPKHTCVKDRKQYRPGNICPCLDYFKMQYGWLLKLLDSNRKG